jgi:hypothetical protein
MHAWVHGADAISMWTAVAYHCWWLDRIVCQRRDPRAAGHTCSQWSHLFSREIDDGWRPDAFLAFLAALRCQPGAGLCARASRHLFSGEVDDDGHSLPFGFPRCHELPAGRGLGTCVSRRALVRRQQHGVKMGPEINCKGEELIKVIKISEESYMRFSGGPRILSQGMPHKIFFM